METAAYSEDADALYLELRDPEVIDARELGLGRAIDSDAEGRVVGITLEHARIRIGVVRSELEVGEG